MNRAAGPAVIEADHVRFAYPHGIEAIADLSFRAAQGEFVAVMGTNGSGKTTLMKILMRLLVPQQGHVRLAGVDIRNLASAELYRQVGMVFQNPADQLFGASVEQDVAFGPRNLGLGQSEVTARVEEALAAVDASELGDRPVHQLSYGQQKRVCLAGVLAMQPKILLLDEPTGGLDPAGELEMIAMLLRLNRQRSITLIVCTHAVDLLPVLADRIYVLRQGQVWHQGPPREVLADPQAVARAGLRMPLISQLFHEVGCCDGVAMPRLPLTIDEGRQQILDWLDARRPAATEGGRP